LKLTKEQNDILENVKTSELLKILAKAGSGKTFISQEIVKQENPKRGLYFAFNKAIVMEGKAKFPHNIECRTIHSLALKHANLTIDNFSYHNIKEDMRYDDKKSIIDSMNKFYSSGSINPKEFFKDYLGDEYLVNITLSYIQKMMKGKIPATFGLVMKYFHILLALGKIKVEYDMVILDEAGDTTEVILEIFKLIDSPKKIMLGDCVASSTRIKTDIGWITSASLYRRLNKGEMIQAYTMKSDNTFTYNKFVQPKRKVYEKDLLKVKTVIGEVTTTYDHRYLTVDGYKRGYELEIGDLLCSIDKDSQFSTSKIEDIINIPYKAKRNKLYVYDFGVEDTHNFICSNKAQKIDASGGLVIHNCYQNIYTFTHTVDGFEYFKDIGDTLSLTKSFRVSNDIAEYIQDFAQENIDEDFIFEGVEREIEENSTCYITRTNSELINTMKMLRDDGVESFNSIRPLDEIFEFSLAMITASSGSKLSPKIYSKYKYLTTEYRKYNKDKKFKGDYFKWLKDSFSKDKEITSTVSLIKSLGSENMFELKQSFKELQNSKSNIHLGTAFVTKGLEYDVVHIGNDLSRTITRILDKNKDKRTKDDYTELLLYYVAASRARHKLYNRV